MQGLELCRRYYLEVVEPLMDNFPSLQYSAALLGPGSEVLGYDTEMSSDHDWSPRVRIFLSELDIGLSDSIITLLENEVPQSFYGYTIHTSMTVCTTVKRFMEECLGIDINEPLEQIDWLTFPSQILLEMTSGAVFKDDTGQLLALRQRLDYYPDDIWVYLMASTWQRIGQEQHLMLRAGYVGDELGSAVIASRLVRDIMNLCFLIERQYAPYPKWFGTAFKKLKCSEIIMPHLWEVQTSKGWRERERALNSLYTCLADMHNELELTEKIASEATSFYTRPYKVMQGEGIASLISSQIKDQDVRWLAENRLIGGIDQITDNTDFRLLSKWSADGGKPGRGILKEFFKPHSTM